MKLHKYKDYSNLVKNEEYSKSDIDNDYPKLLNILKKSDDGIVCKIELDSSLITRRLFLNEKGEISVEIEDGDVIPYSSLSEEEKNIISFELNLF